MCLKRKHEAVAPHRQEKKKSHTQKNGSWEIKNSEKGTTKSGYFILQCVDSVCSRSTLVTNRTTPLLREILLGSWPFPKKPRTQEPAQDVVQEARRNSLLLHFHAEHDFSGSSASGKPSHDAQEQQPVFNAVLNKEKCLVYE